MQKYLERNKRIVEKRGESWRKNLTKGKLEALLKPSIMRVKRVGLDLNQGHIAKSMGLSIAAIGSIERGKRGVTLKRADHLSRLLKSDKRTLFDFKNKRYFVKLINR